MKLRKLIIALFLSQAICVFSSPGDRDDFMYLILPDSTLRITDVNVHGNDSIIIPKFLNVDGDICTVTELGSEVFRNSGNVTFISIPSSVRSLNLNSFQYCTSLTTLSANWEDAGEVQTISSYEVDATYGWVDRICSVDLIVPEGQIEDYLRNRYPWIGFRSISDGTNTIEDQTFWVDGNKFSISDYDKHEVYGSFAHASGRFEVPPRVVSPISGIEYSVVGLGSKAFWGNSELTEAVLPPSIREIEFEAFGKCVNLTSIILPDDIKHIGTGAFQGCTNLQRIKFPANLLSIGGYAFAGCSSLKEVELPVSLRHIQASAFSGCTSLEHLFLNHGLKTLGDESFRGCSSLSDIYFSKELETVGNLTFWDCSSLRHVYTCWDRLTDFPTDFHRAFGHYSITDLHVEPSAFDDWNSDYTSDIFNCFRLITDGIRKSPERLVADGDFLFEVYDIPNKRATLKRSVSKADYLSVPAGVQDNLCVTRIDGGISMDCRNLIIPDGIESIGTGTFNGCRNIQEIVSYSKRPPVMDEEALSGNNFILYVPRGSVNKYMKSPGWSKAAKILPVKSSGKRFTR